MIGRSKGQHGQQQPLSPNPKWKLYENPYFTEGHFVPNCIPRLHLAHHRGSTSSFFVTEAWCASRGSELNLASESCAKPFKAYEAARMHYFPSPLCLPSDRDKFKSGSLVSARKLAAAFWEFYRVQRLENPGCDKQSLHAQARHSHLVSCPFKRPLPSCSCQLCEALEETSETTEAAFETDMASSQKTILTNVLHHVTSVEERQSQNVAALHKLKLDLEDVANCIQELELSQLSALKEAISLLQKFGKQMAITRKREQEKMKLAFLYLRQEIEEERKTCRLLKMQNKKLAKDLTNANIAAADAYEELERERKARELLEEVCNELAREIGEDKAQVQQLKQEQEKYRERLDEELKLMRKMALWQDKQVKDNVPEVSAPPLVEGDGKKCMQFPDLISKLEAFVETSGVFPCGKTQEEIDKQGEQARLLLEPLYLLELQSSRECRDINYKIEEGGSTAPVVSSATLSKECAITETMLNSDGANHMHGEGGPLSGNEQIGSISKAQRSHKLRRRLHTRRKQKRHNVRSIDGSMTEESNHNVRSSDGSMTEESNHNVRSSDGNMIEESSHIKQSLSIEISEGSLKKPFVSTNTENHVEAGKVSKVLYSFSKGDTRLSGMRVNALKRKQEIFLQAQDRHAAGTGQEQSFSGVRDGYDHVHHPNGNLDMHRNIDGRMIDSADSKLGHIFTAQDTLSHEVLGVLDGGANTASTARGISNHNGEAYCRAMVKCTQGSTDVKQVDENTENKTLSTIQELNKLNVEGADSRDYETMRKLSLWIPASAKSLPLPCFWPPSPVGFPVSGQAMKRRIKAFSFSPPSVQDEQRPTTISSGLYSHQHSTEGGITTGAVNQQPLACIKYNSLGAQIIRAIELEKGTKPAKPSCFSPLW